MRRILAESAQFKGSLAAGTVFLVLSSLLQNALPALAGKMLDAVTSHGGHTSAISCAQRESSGRCFGLPA